MNSVQERSVALYRGKFSLQQMETILKKPRNAELWSSISIDRFIIQFLYLSGIITKEKAERL